MCQSLLLLLGGLFVFQKQPRWRQHGLLIGSMLLISILAHSFYIWHLHDGLIMKGLQDGLSQMVPFKQFIYENYSKGNFFYSERFGIGGGIFSQLAYYYSTNIFFLLVAMPVFIVESITKYQVNLHTWIQLVLPMSILKQTAILLVAYSYFKTMSLSKKASYVGAVIYALSPFFFRHEAFWDTLTDVMFWLVLLLIGIEKIIRKQSSTTFIVAVALIFINNFYLAYVNLLIALFYIILRWFMHCTQEEQSIRNQSRHYVIGGLLGFGMGSFAFIPAAMGFLHNVRPPYRDAIPWFEIQDDIVSNPRVLWLPVFIVIALGIKKLYGNNVFRFFAIIAIFGTILHFIPQVGSMFNGFSAPQNRWEAIVILSYAGVFAVAIDHIKYWKVSQVTVISGAFLSLMLVVSFTDSTFSWNRGWGIILLTTLWVVFAIYTLTREKKQNLIMLLVIFFVIGYANVFQATRVIKDSEAPNNNYMISSSYNSKEQRDLIGFMKQRLSTDEARIDWMVSGRNNTPIVQDFRGVSVYSSVLNGDVLNMYQRDLQIKMGKESVSRFSGVGARTNLMSLWQTQFYMRSNLNHSIPYHYHLVKQSKNYNVYENKDLLPAFRVTNALYSEKSLKNQPIIVKDHAMLKGVITENRQTAEVQKVQSTSIRKISTLDATWDGDILNVKKKNGGLLLQLEPSSKTKDLYVGFHIEGIKKKSAFTLQVNEAQTLRKKSNSIYRTGYNDVTFDINKANAIYIRLPEGDYHLKQIHVYEEDYSTLTHALKDSKSATIKWQDDHASGEVKSTQPHQMLVTPIPYEKGWEATINGKKVDIEKVNYAFIGIPLTNGEVNKIEMNYKPPYWTICLSLSLLSLLVFVYRQYRERKHNENIE